MISINSLQKEIHKNAVSHGWWDSKREFGTLIALCHSELSEALEENRKVFRLTRLTIQNPERWRVFLLSWQM